MPQGEEHMKPLSQRTVRTTIGMMRSMANCKPISPFHLMAADEMEQLLEEVLKYRKEKKDAKAETA
jgi:hypothetical protein